MTGSSGDARLQVVSRQGENHEFRSAGQKKEMTMPLIQLIIVLVIVGVVLWVINSYIPMQSTIKKILNVVVIIVVIIWLLSVFGVIDDISTIRIGG
jgi:Flp pilus assembly protein TadB